MPRKKQPIKFKYTPRRDGILYVIYLLHFQNLYQKLAEIYQTETIRKTHAVASAMFKEAVNLELIAANPLTRVKPPKVESEEKTKAMSLVQAKKFLAACSDSPHGVIFEFALETGMRPKVYLALRWSDIDLDKQTAQVVRAVVFDRRGGGFYFKEPKTKRSRGTVPFSDKLTAHLIEYQNRQNEYVETARERLTKRMKPSLENRREYNKQIMSNYEKLNLMFPSQDFTPIKNHNLSRRFFKPILEKAGLSGKFAPFCLRHTCATLLLSDDVHPKIVSERLEHSSIAITLDTYSHVLPTMQETATEKLTAFLYS